MIDVDRPNLSLIRGSLDAGPTLEIAFAAALLDAVARARAPAAVRIHRPVPTVAFGRQDRFLQGFSAAAAAARAHGFAPVLRAPGGHAAAYDADCLVIDEVMPEVDAIARIHERFAEHAARQARALRTLGVDARIGRIPGEYCPGDFTISAGGRTKLVGTAQRVVRGGWLFSTVVVVDGADRLRAVLTDVYAALELDWDPATVGAVADEAAGVGIADVERVLLESAGERATLVPAPPDPAIIEAARRSLDRYAIDT